jgi:hypothetical protein
MINWRASPRNQCPQLWFKTQPFTIGEITLITSQLPMFLDEECGFRVLLIDNYNIGQWCLEKPKHLGIIILD